jgi:hypothetical protein
VPLPNGVEQGTGRDYGATVLYHAAERDELTLDLRGAYPAPAGLERLTRTVRLHRDAPAGWVELVDAFAFAAGPAPFESALITRAVVEQDAGGVVIRGARGALRIAHEAGVAVAVETVAAVDLGAGPADVRRIVYTFDLPRKSGTIRLTITPV